MENAIANGLRSVLNINRMHRRLCPKAHRDPLMEFRATLLKARLDSLVDPVLKPPGKLGFPTRIS